MIKNMKQSTKAKLICMTAIIFLAISLLSTMLVTKANNSLQDSMENQYALVLAAIDFGDASAYLTNEARAYAVSGKEEHYDNYWYEVNTAQNREKNVAIMNQIGLTKEEVALLDKISNKSNELVPYEDEAMRLVQAGDQIGAINILYGKFYEEGITEIQGNIAKLNSSIENRMAQNVAVDRKTAIVLNIISFVLIVCALLALGELVRFVLKELIAPIVKMKDKLVDFSQGNLHGELDLQADDVTEIGMTVGAIQKMQDTQTGIIDDMDYMLTEMANGNFVVNSKNENIYVGDYKHLLQSIKLIIEELNATLVEINQTANQVDSGAEQVAAAAQALSQGATEQAASVEELSATIATVTSEIRSTAEQTETAAKLVGEAEIGLNASLTEMELMLSAMNNIEEKSNEIQKIIKTIDDIAFQTNILALNAAVEAARAGSAGKGFAVVADEVRNLAQKSAEAAKETTDLIAQTAEAISEGTQIAHRTGEAVNQVVDSARQVAVIVSNIKESAYQESDAAEQINIGIEQISCVVQTNSATAEESAASSEEMSAQADTLQALINQFKLKE